MLVILRGFLLLFLLYHVLVTVLWFGIFQGNFPQIPALARDWLWMVLLIGYFFTSLSTFKSYRRQRKQLRYLFFTLLGISVFFSYIQEKTIYDMFVWFKYGFHYIFLFLSATFLGHVFAKPDTKQHTLERDEKVYGFLRFFVWTLVSVVVIWFFWQWAKLIFPDFFFWLGYGPLNDFFFWVHPPIYYLTGFWGTLRWQWIFAGPNNYGYFLVVFLPLIISYFKFSLNSWKDIFIKKQNLISLFVYFLRFGAIVLTLSRSALLGTIVVLFLMNIHRWKRHWKISIAIIGIGIIGIFGLSFLKESSTLAHITAKFSSIWYVLSKPLWYGLWSSWPAIHHNGNILPENYFIQLLIDIWIIGFLIFVWWYIVCRKKIKKMFHGELFGSYIRAFAIGWIALLIMWIFLHVFEDSMVNYTFFTFFGVIIWYVFHTKKEPSK